MQCISPFLPAGYPSSVTPDYTPYQIYDSLQAFASTIAGLLASRAVFVGMGVGSEDASLVTTMLLYIAQETIGRVATIMFAHRFSQRIEAEVKFYRFFADIVNDIAFVLDCTSPGLPILGRVFALCVSNACRAVCGVAGGSSKAILSSHFAKVGNIGELNAKDGSQETVVSLVGMWVGGIVVSKVHGAVETWGCLLPLLALHLWANWKAVKSVRLNSLNAERATILFEGILNNGHAKTLNEVGKEESILGFGSISRASKSRVRVGVCVHDLLFGMFGDVGNNSLQYSLFVQLVQTFREEDYLLWFNIRTDQGVILLKESASGETQAKSFFHFLRCSRGIQASTRLTDASQQHHLGNNDQTTRRNRSDIDLGLETSGGKERADIGETASRSSCEDGHEFRIVTNTLRENRAQWPKIRDEVERSGWDLGLTNLVKGHGRRVRLDHGVPFEAKKDK